MKQKLAYYEVESSPKNEFSLYLITFHSNVAQFVVSLFESLQLKNCFSKQNVYVNQLNIVLLYALRSDDSKSLQRNGRNQVPI